MLRSPKAVLLALIFTLPLTGCSQTPLDAQGEANLATIENMVAIAGKSDFAGGSTSRTCEIEFDCTYNGSFRYSTYSTISESELPQLCERFFSFADQVEFETWEKPLHYGEEETEDFTSREAGVTACKAMFASALKTEFESEQMQVRGKRTTGELAVGYVANIETLSHENNNLEFAFSITTFGV